MKRFKQRLLMAVAGLLLAQSAAATVVTFDGSEASWNTAYDSSNVDVIFQTDAYGWGSGYNNLTNVAYGDIGGKLIIDFKSLSGANITLNSFDLGNYLGNGAAITYEIFDLANLAAPLVSQSTSVAYSISTHATVNVGLSSTSGLRLALGPDIYNNAVDNISFTAAPAAAAVPEPTGLSLVGLALGLLGLSARGRRLSR